MKRGFHLVFTLICMLVMLPSVFSLVSIGYEYNITPQTTQQGSLQSIRCLGFNSVSDQIECRLTATHIVPIQSVFCAETVETKWCQQLLIDAVECFDEFHDRYGKYIKAANQA